MSEGARIIHLCHNGRDIHTEMNELKLSHKAASNAFICYLLLLFGVFSTILAVMKKDQALWLVSEWSVAIRTTPPPWPGPKMGKEAAAPDRVKRGQVCLNTLLTRTGSNERDAE